MEEWLRISNFRVEGPGAWKGYSFYILSFFCKQRFDAPIDVHTVSLSLQRASWRATPPSFCLLVVVVCQNWTGLMLSVGWPLLSEVGAFLP